MNTYSMSPVRAIALTVALCLALSTLTLVTEWSAGTLRATRGTGCVRVVEVTHGKTVINTRVCMPDVPNP
ncbi:MAG: hypothetical protein ACJ735_10770 [Actinomycetes bacterium]